MQRASSSSSKQLGISEFDVLKASHKFLREDDEQHLSWEDQVAKKYYDSLFREFAVCNLKHYKTGQFALRWRTESEVLSGAGEETCGNTRCTYHEPSRSLKLPTLKTVELPFAYDEDGATKSALVKVVLCDKCIKKLMYKRDREKAGRAELSKGAADEIDDGDEAWENDSKRKSRGGLEEEDTSERRDRREREKRRDRKTGVEGVRERHSRSKSPRRRERPPANDD